MSFSDNSLHNYYQTTFLMMKEHNFTLSEIENMLPWEKFIYESLIIKYLQQKQEEYNKLKKSK